MALPVNAVKTYYSGDTEAEGVYSLQRFKYAVDEEGVALATWCLPARLNPITRGTNWELFLILEHASRDPAVKAFVLTGEGRAFSAGMSPLPDDDPLPDEEVMQGYLKREKAFRGETNPSDGALKGIVLAFLRFPKFLICAVNGLAVGGGLNIALLLTDHAIVARSARFRYPFTELGLTAEIGSSFLLPERIGLARAKELLMLGDWFSAEDAYRLGLCNSVVDDAEVLPTAMALAKRVAGMNQTSLRLAKALIHRPVLERLEAQLDAENATIAEAIASPETKASMKAFAARFKRQKEGAPKAKL